MFSLIKLAVIAAVIGQCKADMAWVRGGTTCAGHDDAGSPTKVGFGPCNDDGSASQYITQEPSDMAAICDINTYTTDTTQVNPVTPYESGGRYFFGLTKDSGETINGQSGCEYAYLKATMAMGENTGAVTNGGYVGVATYISTGSAACTGSVMSLPNAILGGCVDDCTETKEICIMDTSPGSTCDGVKSYAPGSTKFSITLLTGSTYSMPSVSCGTISHVGVRVTYNYSKMGAGSTIFFNGNTGMDLTNVGTAQVNKFTVTGANGKSVSITFPTGITHGAYNPTTGEFSKSGVGNVKIRAVESSGSNAFHIDVLFLGSYFSGANMWAAYDPNVESTGGSGASAIVASAMSVAILAILAMTHMW